MAGIAVALLFLLGLYPEASVAADQGTLGVRGSFVVAAICKDGVIIAADSRGTIFDPRDNNKTPLANLDTMQKVFPIGANAIGATGHGVILDTFFSEIVDRVRPRLSANITTEKLLPAFLDISRHQLDPVTFGGVRKQIIIAAGHISGARTICYFNEAEAEPFGCIGEPYGVVQSDKTSLSGTERELASRPCDEVATRATAAIKGYAGIGERWKTIGGPISVFLVTPTGSRWLRSKPPLQPWRYGGDFLRDYRGGLVRLTVIPPATKSLLDTLFGAPVQREP